MGKMVYSLGGSYEGQWKEGKFHGKGKVTYVGGRTITTEFVEGRRVGQAPAATSAETNYRLPNPGPSGSQEPTWTTSPVPYSRTYTEMSPEHKQIVRDWYVLLDDDDEPPYPANGTKKIYEHIYEAQQVRLARGRLYMHVNIDKQGNPTSVTTYASPDPEMTRWVSAVLVTQKYKPGLCQGKPCAMSFPISIKFSAEEDE